MKDAGELERGYRTMAFALRNDKVCDIQMTLDIDPVHRSRESFHGEYPGEMREVSLLFYSRKIPFIRG